MDLEIHSATRMERPERIPERGRITKTLLIMKLTAIVLLAN